MLAGVSEAVQVSGLERAGRRPPAERAHLTLLCQQLLPKGALASADSNDRAVVSSKDYCPCTIGGVDGHSRTGLQQGAAYSFPASWAQAVLGCRLVAQRANFSACQSAAEILPGPAVMGAVGGHFLVTRARFLETHAALVAPPLQLTGFQTFEVSPAAALVEVGRLDCVVNVDAFDNGYTQKYLFVPEGYHVSGGQVGMLRHGAVPAVVGCWTIVVSIVAAMLTLAANGQHEPCGRHAYSSFPFLPPVDTGRDRIPDMGQHQRT